MSDEEKRNYSKEYQEMVQIEEGLERFLEQELEDMRKSRQIPQGSRSFYDEQNSEQELTQEQMCQSTHESAYESAHKPSYEAEEQRVRSIKQNAEYRTDYEPRHETEPDMAQDIQQKAETEENNMAGTGRKTGKKQAKTLQDDYLEDWDLFTGRKPSGKRGTASRDSSDHSTAGNATAARGSTNRGSTRRSSSNYSSAGNATAARGSTNSRSSAAKGKKTLPPKKKKSGFKRFLITVALLIAFIGIAQYCLVSTLYAKMNYKKIETESIANAPLKEDGVINILLIGNDSRQNGEDGRSDAMILLSISRKTKTIYMTSLLRDMYVDIPGHDGNRLNAAYSFGGAELLMTTIEQNLDISVNRYMLVNFEAFANLVDAVNGVDLELDSAEVEYVNAYLQEYNILTNRPEGTDYMDTSLSGMLHLNGPQALAYTRNRYLGTDFGRTERQRKVLSAVIKKLPAAAVTNSKELMDGLLPNLTTNLTQNECYQLSFLAPELLSYDLVQSSIPLSGTYKNANIRGMAVLEVDFDANKKYIQENIYGK